MKKPVESKSMHENMETTPTSVKSNNEWINGFIIGCAIKIILIGVVRVGLERRGVL